MLGPLANVHVCFIVCVPILVVLWMVLRRWFKVRVNCWFCNQNSKVDFKDRNWWLCTFCKQYNGFSKDGDYNYEIPEQKYERLNPLIKGRNWMKREPQPDLTAGLGAENGLCATCNANQALKVRLLANFVPTSEDKFDAEMDNYRKRVEKVYGLCAVCQEFVKRKLNSEYENMVRHRTAPRIVENKKPSETSSGKIRKHRVSAGRLARYCHLSGIAISALVWLSNLHRLQEDSDNRIVPLTEFLPIFLINSFPYAYKKATWFCAAGLLSQLTSMIYGKARLIILDFMLTLTWLAMVIFHWGDTCLSLAGLLSRGVNSKREDCLLWQCGLASSCLFVAFSVAALPRKRRRKNQSRIKAGLSLSLASTPSSQRSDLNGSTLSTSFDSADVAKRSQTIFGTECGGRSDSDFCEIIEPNSKARATAGKDVRIRRSPRMTNGIFGLSETVINSQKSSARETERRRRELTPSRILGNQLSGLSLGKQNQEQGRQRRGPFSSLKFPAAAVGRQNESLFGRPTPSNVLSPPKLNLSTAGSHFTSTGREKRFSPSHVGDNQSVCSWMTSVSQRQPVTGPDSRTDVSMSGVTSAGTSRGDKLFRMVVLVVLLGSLATNVLVVYYLMNKTM